MKTTIKEKIKNKNAKRIILCGFVSLFLAAIFCVLPLANMFGIAEEYIKQHKYGISYDEYDADSVVLNNYEINGNKWVATTEDPNILLEGVDSYVENISLKFNKKLKHNVNIKVYYTEDYADFSEEEAIGFIAEKGKKKVVIPIEHVTNDLRIDIGDAQGVSFSLKIIEINDKHIRTIDKIKTLFVENISSRITLDRIILLFLILFFIELHFIVGVKKLYSFLFKYRWAVGACVLLFLIINQYHGNSITMYNNVVQPGQGDDYIEPVFGQERAIRSDEWVVDAGSMFSTRYLDNPYGKLNYIARGTETVNNGQISIASIVNPLSFLGQIIRYVFGFEYYYSYSWNVVAILGFLFQIEFLMILTSGNKLWSVLVTILVAFSSFALWWQYPPLFCYGPAALVCFYHFFESDIVWKKLLLAYGTGLFTALFITIFYPAWEVPMGYFCLVVFVWMIAKQWNKIKSQKLLGWSLIVFGLLICIIIVSSTLVVQMDYLSSITATEYPGSRVDYGSFSLNKLFYYIPAILFAYKDIGNPCEMGTIISFFPVPLIAAVIFLLKSKKDKKTKGLIIGLIVISVFLSMYCYTNLPYPLAHYTLMDNSTSARCVDIVAYIQVIILGIVGSSWEKQEKCKLWFGIPISGIVTAIILYSADKYTDIYYPNYLNSVEYIVWGVMLMLVSCALICNWNTTINYKIERLAVVSMAIIALVTGIYIRPIVKGIDAIDSKPLASEIHDIIKVDGHSKWIACGGGIVFPSFTIASGAPTINSVNTYPNMEMWNRLDPSGLYNEVYNRYAHINLELIGEEEDTHMELMSADLICLYLSVKDLDILNIKYIASLYPMDIKCSEFEYEKIYSESGAYIYELHYN